MGCVGEWGCGVYVHGGVHVYISRQCLVGTQYNSVKHSCHTLSYTCVYIYIYMVIAIKLVLNNKYI